MHYLLKNYKIMAEYTFLLVRRYSLKIRRVRDVAICNQISPVIWYGTWEPLFKLESREISLQVTYAWVSIIVPTSSTIQSDSNTEFVQVCV